MKKERDCVDLAGMDHQQQIKDIEEKEDEEYEYNKNNKEDICYD